jgi:hypothetical protein
MRTDFTAEDTAYRWADDTAVPPGMMAFITFCADLTVIAA